MATIVAINLTKNEAATLASWWGCRANDYQEEDADEGYSKEDAERIHSSLSSHVGGSFEMTDTQWAVTMDDLLWEAEKAAGDPQTNRGAILADRRLAKKIRAYIEE